MPLSMVKLDEFNFVPPPECPVFRPTPEEFKEPLKYVAKIRPIAEKSGICKVIPPDDWTPPFAVDVDAFKFVPRIQRLNELAAETRVKLQFLDNIAKFWELQGSTLKIPHAGKKVLDLWKLHSSVSKEGGFESCCKERKWTKIASDMGKEVAKHVGANLRQHYERILYPWDLFKAGEPFKRREGGGGTPVKDAGPKRMGGGRMGGGRMGGGRMGGGSSGRTITADAAADKKSIPTWKGAGLPSSSSNLVDPAVCKEEKEAGIMELKTEDKKEKDRLEADSGVDGVNGVNGASSSRNEVGVDDVKAEASDEAAVDALSMSEGAEYASHALDERQSAAAHKSSAASMSAGSSVGGAVRRSRRMGGVVCPDADPTGANKELRKLAFYGAGPKMPGFDAAGDLSTVPDGQDAVAGAADGKVPPEGETAEQRRKMRKRVPGGGGMDEAKIETVFCQVCSHGDNEDLLLMCDGCDDAHHTYCLIPPLTEIPKKDWKCPKCVAGVVNKPHESFGFEQAPTEYNLQTFGEMADTFKSAYFNMPVHMVPCSVVEKEFWRIMDCVDEDVSIQYGADVHSLEMGSGFPTPGNINYPEDEEYANAGWNLNVLPVLEGSILRYISGDISGMKVPWCYVGMCFATFCWHIEDHWSYSINYMHWGEPKTWYGVSSEQAELLEETMKQRAPDLFENQPDLLHQLVTIMNPNSLMERGVRVVRTNQCAGEFVITFPRAYHAGFNQGYNFAEAVNFAPADWLKMGRECVEHYRTAKRFCVFSHEELICKMAACPDDLQLDVAIETYDDMLHMVDTERGLRKSLMERGTVEAEREAFELLPDDERQCDVCKTTCFLSAVTCPCINRLVCSHHADKLCQCPPSKHILRYRYTLDELPAMLHRLKVRIESYECWADEVKTALEPASAATTSTTSTTTTSTTADDSRPTLEHLKELVTRAEEEGFTDSELLALLSESIGEAEKCAGVARQLASQKMKTRARQSGDSRYSTRLSIDELHAFADQIRSLPCIIKEERLVEEMFRKVSSFQMEAEAAIYSDDAPNRQIIDGLLETAASVDVEFEEVPRLKQLLAQAQWLEKVKEKLYPSEEEDEEEEEEENEEEGGEQAASTVDVIQALLDESRSLVPHPAVEKMRTEMQELIFTAEELEEKAKRALDSAHREPLLVLTEILDKAKLCRVRLPNVNVLKETCRQAQAWLKQIEGLQNAEHYPYLETLETIVAKARPIPVYFDNLSGLESDIAAARNWRERTARTFLKKNSRLSLAEVLAPRVSDDAALDGASDHGLKNLFLSEEAKHATVIVQAFKAAELHELSAMKRRRTMNREKLPYLEKALDEAKRLRQAKNSPKKEEMRFLPWASSAGTSLSFHRWGEDPTSSDNKVDLPDDPEKQSFCSCGGPASDVMIQCTLCLDWFHSPKCVPPPKILSTGPKKSESDNSNGGATDSSVDGKAGAGATSLLTSLTEGKYLCAGCLRSRRPRLETILSLLVALQKLSVRLPEGEALQCLTERAMAWQDRARQLLDSPSLSSALSRLTRLDPGSSQQQLQQQQPQQKDNQADIPSVGAIIKSGSSSPPQQRLGGVAGHSPPAAGAVAAATASTTSPHKKSRKQCLVPTPSSPNDDPLPSLTATTTTYSMASTFPDLDPSTRDKLEKLLVEGELLEVSLEETRHIWRLLNAAATAAKSAIRSESGGGGGGDYPRWIRVFPESEHLLLEEASSGKGERKKRKTQKLLAAENGAAAAAGGGDAASLAASNQRPISPIKIKKKKKREERLSCGADGEEAEESAAAAEVTQQHFIVKEKKRKKRLSSSSGAPTKPSKHHRKSSVDGGGGVGSATASNIEGSSSSSTSKVDSGGDDDDDDDDDADDDEDCAASRCMKPSGRAVNWVQCDGGCEMWFHLICVGLTKLDVADDVEFLCSKCRKKKKPKRDPPAADEGIIDITMDEEEQEQEDGGGDGGEEDDVPPPVNDVDEENRNNGGFYRGGGGGDAGELHANSPCLSRRDSFDASSTTSSSGGSRVRHHQVVPVATATPPFAPLDHRSTEGQIGQLLSATSGGSGGVNSGSGGGNHLSTLSQSSFTRMMC